MRKFIETIKNIYKIEELRTRIGYTLLLVLIYRLGCFIVLPVSTRPLSPACRTALRKVSSAS